jgi:Rhs element Vgr protein
MPSSPFLSATDAVGLEISISGANLDDSFQILHIETDISVNRVGTARIHIALPKGAGSDKTFTSSDLDKFAPGTDVDIKIGSLNNKTSVFKGLITSTGIRNLTGHLNELILKCSEKSILLTLNRNSNNFDKKKDSEVVSQLVSDCGLTADVTATTTENLQLVQFQSTNWDFIVSRADANGMLVYMDNEKVCFKSPETTGDSALKIDFESDVFNFDLQLEGRYQLKDMSTSSWDIAKQSMESATGTEPSLPDQGNLDGKTMAGKMGFPSAKRSAGAPLTKTEITDWAKAQLLRSRYSAIQGNITFFGNNTPCVNTLIELTGFGSRFNNNGLITGVRHQVKDGLWLTTVSLGLNPKWHFEQYPVSAPAASGLLPAVYGLQTGTVLKVSDDPDGHTRVQVSVPAITTDGTGLWARMAGFYATSGKGALFLPEVNDEVVLGFMNDDPRYPVILGSLYSSKNAAPYTPETTNKIKAIVTKSDIRIEMNDEDKVVTVKTPGGNQFILSDKEKSVTLKDQNGNKIEMSASGITIDSSKDIIIKSGTKISLEGTSGISAKASGGDVGLEGLNINAKASVAFAAQGSATAELKSTGSTTVKGAVVMIN